MTAFRYQHVCIEGVGYHVPPTEVTSAEIEDRIAPLYHRLGVPFGTLERVSGVHTRRVWGREMAPSTAGAEAVRIALNNMKIDPKHIGALLSCSVARDLFEPATACLIHHKVGLPEGIMAFDITNACLGFSNGLTTVANLIESGVIKAGIVVSGENTRIILDSNFALIEKNQDTMTREDLLKILPTFTLGCGAVAFVLCHESLSSSGHRFRGAVARSATEHADLCSGNGDFCVMRDEEQAPVMSTESSKLIAAASKLGGRTWAEASEVLGWSKEDVDHVFCHQVGRQVNEAFYAEMNLPWSKDFAIYRDYGNMVSAAMPIALLIGAEKVPVKPKDKVVCTAFGSGLNSIFLGIEW